MEKDLIQDKDIPLRHYNYSYIKGLLEERYNAELTGGFALIMDAKRPIIDAKSSGRTFGSRAEGEGAKRATGRSLSTPHSRAFGAGTLSLTGAKKQSEERAALFAVRVEAVVSPKIHT